MAMNISAWSIRHPLPSVVFSIILLALGWISFTKLAITRLPAVPMKAGSSEPLVHEKSVLTMPVKPTPAKQILITRDFFKVPRGYHRPHTCASQN